MACPDRPAASGFWKAAPNIRPEKCIAFVVCFLIFLFIFIVVYFYFYCFFFQFRFFFILFVYFTRKLLKN